MTPSVFSTVNNLLSPHSVYNTIPFFPVLSGFVKKILIYVDWVGDTSGEIMISCGEIRHYRQQSVYNNLLLLP